MEQMILFILKTIGAISLGLVTNIIWDKVKSHSPNCDRKSGCEFEFKLIEFKFKNK
ncbi:hypothetical protein UMC2_35941 [[Clostridium] sordellii]|uniref:hypothetical protein n=1 Tax=Paraclostridium sordellii TaxID=1505 RepID=UPI00054389A6|nr:hypothetical protein [Paeniclostridium sordellii]CEK34383.1 hypothetical protein UMC2_35941 [[Clostridium] sordellii] [Paeniclostridium sordellii]